MRVVVDIEADALVNPKNIWLIVCKDIDTGERYIFRKITEDASESKRFREFSEGCTQFIGHNILGYDYPVLHNLLNWNYDPAKITDTLILSKLIDYSRKAHSIEDYGLEFNIPKGKFIDFTSGWSQEMEDYCVRDVDICHRVYSKYQRYVDNPAHMESIRLEHRFQLVVNALHNNGFSFNADKARKLLSRVEGDLSILDKDILEAFPPKLKLIREVHPKETKYGTLSKTDFRWLGDGDISDYNGGSFCRCSWESFNPSSHKQIIAVLNQAGWAPVDKTQTHIDTEREVNRLKYTRGKDTALDLRKKELIVKLEELKKTGWKVNENNLDTLSATSPVAARLLAKRILLESRRRTLTEWLSLVTPQDRIHGKFYGIGAWTHRMAHQAPNTANIPNAVKVSDGSKVLLGKELRSLWCVPNKNRLLVGVDAEAIQLRVFAHLINDPALINAIVNGKKSDGTDPHSLNKTYFGSYCKTRNAAKHSLYAMFFGGKGNKIAEIMGCHKSEAEEAIEALVQKYPGLAHLQKEVFPIDARRGYFIGLDGRKVRIPGDTISQRLHLCMSGYLQNGEKVVMAKASVRFEPMLAEYDSLLVNLVHDEWQTETPNNMDIAIKVAQLQCDALEWAGKELNMNCPIAGSYWNDDHKDYTIATNWSATH